MIGELEKRIDEFIEKKGGNYDGGVVFDYKELKQFLLGGG